MSNASKLKYHVDGAGCWIWDGYVAANGYARIYDAAKKQIVWAHRYSFELVNGPIPAGMEIDHMCQVTGCVNPDHLQMLTRLEHVRVTFQRLGKDDLHAAAAVYRRQGLTYAEIAEALKLAGKESAFFAVQAAVRKGLIDAADVPPVPRLTEADREDIRALHCLGIPQTVIGDFYNTDSSQISRICNGRASGHAA